MMVGIHTMRNALLRKLIEYGGGTGNAAVVVNIFLLDIIEVGQKFRTYTALKKRSHPQDMPSKFFEDLARHAMIQDCLGQETRRFQPSKWRTGRIVIKQIPVTGNGRRNASQNRRDRARAEAKHSLQRHSVGQNVIKKLPPFQILPTQSIN